MRAYCQEWLATKEPETAPQTQVFYRTSTAKFITFLGKRAEAPLSEITKTDIVAYRNSLAKSLSANRQENSAARNGNEDLHPFPWMRSNRFVRAEACYSHL